MEYRPRIAERLENVLPRAESWLMPTIFATLRSEGDAEPCLDPALEPAAWTHADFTRIVAPHLPQLYRLSLILSRDATEAEDLLQNALVKAYVHRASYAGRGSLSAWLYGIVRNERMETVRSNRRRRSLLEAALARFADLFEDLSPEGAAPTNPELAAMAQQESELLLACLRRVPEPYRTVVYLCDVEERSYEEVAELLDAPLGTIKSRHARGRVKLRKVYDALEEDE